MRETNPFRDSSLLHPELSAKIEQAKTLQAERDRLDHSTQTLASVVINKLIDNHVAYEIDVDKLSDKEWRVYDAITEQLTAARSGYIDFAKALQAAECETVDANLDDAELDRLFHNKLYEWYTSGSFEYIHDTMFDDDKEAFVLVATPNIEVSSNQLVGAVKDFSKQTSRQEMYANGTIWNDTAYPPSEWSGQPYHTLDGGIPPVRFSLISTKKQEWKPGKKDSLDDMRDKLSAEQHQNPHQPIGVPRPLDAIASWYSLRHQRSREDMFSQWEDDTETTFIDMPEMPYLDGSLTVPACSFNSDKPLLMHIGLNKRGRTLRMALK